MGGRAISDLERHLENLGGGESPLSFLYRTSLQSRLPSANDLETQRRAVEKLLTKAGSRPWLFLLPEARQYRDCADVFHFGPEAVQRRELSLFIRDTEHYDLRLDEGVAVLTPTRRIELVMLPYEAASRMFVLNPRPYYSIRKIALIKDKACEALA